MKIFFYPLFSMFYNKEIDMNYLIVYLFCTLVINISRWKSGIPTVARAIGFRPGLYPGGLWYDSNPTKDRKPGYGINLQWMWGPLWWNPFGSLIITLPFIMGPFLSVSIGKYGFYVGFKQSGMDVPLSRQRLIPSVRMTKQRDL